MDSVLVIDDDNELCALMKKCVEHEKSTVYKGLHRVGI